MVGLLYRSTLVYYYPVVAQMVFQVVVVTARYKVIVAFLVEEVFLVATFVDYVATVVILSGGTSYGVYCPQFFSFSTVKELDGVAIGIGHLLWQI